MLIDHLKIDDDDKNVNFNDVEIKHYSENFQSFLALNFSIHFG